MGSLTSIQREVLVGSMLGDGSLRRQNGRRNALFEVNHSFKFKEYVDWKHSVFSEFILTPPKARIGKGVRVAYRFTTRSLAVFTDYHQRFYGADGKRIPAGTELTPLSLAVCLWTMAQRVDRRSISTHSSFA